jgi:nitrogen fixation-related uncharacterized protein
MDPPIATREQPIPPQLTTGLPERQSGWAERWAWEILFVIAVAGWILYEVYGRATLEWLSQYTMYIRIAGGIVVIAYLWWQLRAGQVSDTMDLAKQILRDSGGSTTREKRNVSGLMKKKIAASQGWKCSHCKSLLDETYEVDHRLALFNGGTNDESNLEALCPGCHRKKTVNERLESPKISRR